MTIKISSPAGLKQLTITDSKQLDTINASLMTAKETNVQVGGAYEIWADILVYKNGKKANFLVQFSKYNGWMIVFRNRTFKSDYIFNLINRLSKI